MTFIAHSQIDEAPYCLSSGEAVVWYAYIDQWAQESLAVPFATLSETEQNRANRFRYEPLRRSYTICKWLTREILARYLTTASNAIRFEYGAYGKPELAAPHKTSGITFNISHSENMFLIALTKYRKIGVDVEYRRPLSDLSNLAKQILTDVEWRSLQALPQNQHLTLFFEWWVRKESYVKAVGKGLSLDMRTIEIPLESYPTTFSDGDMGSSSQWSLLPLQIDQNYAAALSIEGCNSQFISRQWVI